MKQLFLLMAICLTLIGSAQRAEPVPIYVSTPVFTVGCSWSEVNLEAALEIKEVETSQLQFNVWPNPFEDRVFTDFKYSTVEVFSIQGALQSRSLEGLSNLPPGLYLIRFNNNSSLTKLLSKL